MSKIITPLFLFTVLLPLFNCTDDGLPLPTIDPPADRDSAFTIITPFWSPDGSKIMFFGNVFPQEGYGLYEVDSSGGIARVLMRDTLAKKWPVLSPDGSRIAYLAAELGRLFCCAHVWVMNSDGTNPTDLTPFFSNWENVRWSPDSRYLVFDGAIEDSGIINYQVVRVDAQSGELRQLTSGAYGNRDPTYTHDGTRITYLSGRLMTAYGGKVWVMNADGTNNQPIDTTNLASTYPRPSPFSNDMQFVWGLGEESESGSYSVNLDSTGFPALPLSFHRRSMENYLNLAQWSPDGNSILFVRTTSPQTQDLFLIDANGAGMHQLTSNFSVFLFSYSWSRDSRNIVFEASDDFSQSTHIWVYSIWANTLRKLQIMKPLDQLRDTKRRD